MRTHVRNVVVVVGLLALAAATWASTAGIPANKTSAAGSSKEIMGPNVSVTLLSERIKTSKPTDLLLSASAECAIVTDVTTVGNDSERAFGEVLMWVTIDGTAVPVAADDTKAGRVVFCNRAYQRTTTFFDDEDNTIATFFSDRHANAFNWMALNVGSGVHLVELKAKLTEEESSAAANAEAVVASRTLIIEPTRSAHREAVTELAP